MLFLPRALLLLLALGLLPAAAAHAQSIVPGTAHEGTGTGTGTAEGETVPPLLAAAPEEEAPALLDQVDTTDFLTRSPFGFSLETPGLLLADISDAALRISAAMLSRLGNEPSALALDVALLIGILLLIAGLIRLQLQITARVDGRAHRLFQRLRSFPITAESIRTLLRVSGRLLLLLLLWALTSVPLLDLLGAPSWGRALSAALGALLVGTLVLALLQEGARLLRAVAADAAVERIRRALISSTLWVLLFYTSSAILGAIDYREDVQALSSRATLAAATLLALRFFLLRTEFMALLPEEGSRTWQQFRALCSRYFPWLIAASVLLLLLWTLGYENAATSLLVRAWALVLLLVAVALGARWLGRQLERKDLDDQSLLSSLLREVDVLVRVVAWIIVGWVFLAVLGLLPLLLAQTQRTLLLVGETPITFYNIGKAIIFFVSVMLGARLLRIALEERILPSMGMDSGAAYALSTIARYLVLTLAAIASLVIIGFNLSSLAVFAGALGVGIGFGLQDYARNLLSGLILLIGRSVEKGDLISVGGDVFGWVQEVGTRSVTVRTNDRSELVIPSSELVNGTIINWTHSETLIRLHIPVGVSYKADPREVQEALIEAAGRYPQVAHDPAPDVWLTGFGNSSVDFKLLVWIDATEVPRDQALGRILFHVWDVLKERGIEIPFPQRDLHLRSLPEGLRPDPERVRIERSDDEKKEHEARDEALDEASTEVRDEVREEVEDEVRDEAKDVPPPTRAS